MRSGRMARLLVALLCVEVSVTESKFLARGPKWIFQLALLDSRSPVTPDHVRDLPAIAGAVRSDVDSDDSAEAVPTLLSGPGDPDRLLVSLSAFGQNLRLNATRDGGRGGLLAAQLAVEERWAAGASPTRSRMDRNQLCLYSGSVLDRPGSLVSLTACGGLTALVHVGGEVLFVRPLEKRELSSRLGAFSGLKHQVMRRRRRAERDADHASQRCGTARQDVTERKSSKVTEELRAKRAAIGVEDAYTVETLLVADSDMVRYHGADAAKRFLLTVMNMVYNMFQHQSLGVRINIRVTKLVLLHSRPETLKVGHHGERSLGSFCQWQHEEFGGPRYLGSNHVPGGRDEIPPVDSAVLVTRTDFCVHKEEPCDTVGMAYLGGVCSAKRKCVLAEDNGLNLAFTIAHELGHNVGMSHDDDHAACAGHAYIMSGEWVKGRNPSDLSWSSCSRDDLQKFLRSKSSACLAHTDPRTRDQLPLPPKLPGMHYSVDQQCQILFGSNATFCSDMKHLMCAGLWCLVEGDGSCKTKLDPPLDGTQCGPDKWCRASECVSKTPIPQHVDGDWSPWSPWSMCSRTCATGVRFRQRKCDHPPPGPGGHPCPNANVQHKACEGPPCPKGAPSFRDLQCLSYDRNGGKKKSDVLTAVVDDEKPCALFCSPVGRDISVLMADRVMDGTPCGPFEADLCVNGRCQTIGCDGVIGSSSKEDVCGVCNGDGRSCTVIRGDFNHTRGMGYVEAVVIPAGARRIRIVEDKPSHSFLALKDGGGGGDGKSINSDWKIELPGEFRVAGTTVRYVRRGLWEKMWARGPTSAPLRLLVLLFHDRSYSIHYEYTLSLNASQDKRRPESKETQQQQQQQQQHHHHNNNNGDHLYIWTHSGWNSCNVHCGGGERRTAVSCARLANKTAEVVDDSFCRADNRPPPRVAACDPRPCRFRWVSGEWGPCSATCGAGTQRRRVACVQRRHDGSPAAGGAWEEEEREGGRCQGPRPPPLRACEGRRCPGPGVGVWEASEWSQCSEGCGTGVRTRNITCGGNCDPLTRPDRQEPCQDRSHCYEWKTGQWSKVVASDCHRGISGSEFYHPRPAPFFNRSFEAAYGNPYRAPPLHERRRVKHESLDDLQASTYFGPTTVSASVGGGKASAGHGGTRAARPADSLSFNVEDERLNFHRNGESRFRSPRRAAEAEAAAGSPHPGGLKAGESARRLRVRRTDGPSFREASASVGTLAESGVKKGPAGTARAAFKASDQDSELIADDISDIFRFLDEMSVCDSLGAAPSSRYDSGPSLGSDSGDSLPERATVRLARSQPDRLLRSLDSADGELKVSVGELVARMGDIEKKLESLSGVRGEISQVLRKLNKLDQKIREPDAADGGARHRDAPESSPPEGSRGAAASPHAFRCRTLPAADGPRVEAPKKTGFTRRSSRSLDDDAGAASPPPGNWRTRSYLCRRDDGNTGDGMCCANQASARARQYGFPPTPRPPKAAAASYVPDRRSRPPPHADGSPLYSNVRMAAPSRKAERYKPKAGDDAIDVQAECVPASNKLAFWLEDIYTPGYDSLLKRREADFRRAKACKMAALIAATFSVILVIVVPICTMKT